MPDYRKPTPKQEQDLERARQLRQRAFTGQQDFLDRISTSASKQTRDDLKEADRLSNAVPASVKEYEAYKYSGHKKGGTVKKRVRRFNGGGDIENYEDAPAPKVERIGKSALEEGEEIFKAEKAKRSKHTSATPSRKVTDYGDETSRMMSRAPARTPIRDAGTVPVGVDEAAPRMDTRPQARQPSELERTVEGLPVGKIGAGLASAAGTAYAGYKAAQRMKAAKQMRDAELMRGYEAARGAQRGELDTAATFLKNYRESLKGAGERGSKIGDINPRNPPPDRAERIRKILEGEDAGSKASSARLSREETGRRMRERGEPREKGVSFGFKKGGMVSASRRGDGIAQRGKTRGKLVK